jgi:hypothetical protein
MVAVPFGAIVEGGAVLMAIEMPEGVVVVPPEEDETAPQPEKPTASSRTLATANSPHFDDTRIFSTLRLLVKISTSGPTSRHDWDRGDGFPAQFQLRRIARG